MGCWDKEFAPIGLIFEGSPSSREQKEDVFSLAGPTDILIRGLLLTPDRFAEWLGSVKATGAAGWRGVAVRPRRWGCDESGETSLNPGGRPSPHKDLKIQPKIPKICS
mgnify:CR=1 FL=1